MYRALFVLIVLMLIGCGSASNKDDSPSPTYSSTFNPPQLVNAFSHAAGVGWQQKNCFTCHPTDYLRSAHRFSPSLGASFKSLGMDQTGVCLYCHNSNGLNVTEDMYDCTFCHENRNIVKNALDLKKPHLHDVNQDGVIDNKDCVICHKTTDMNGAIQTDIDFNVNVAFSSTTDFCLGCHSAGGYNNIIAPPLKYDNLTTNIYDTFVGIGNNILTADVHGYGKGNVSVRYGTFRGSYNTDMVVPCISCHTPHSSNNTYLIAESGYLATQSDEQGRNATITVVDNNFTELCAVCHTSTDNSSPTTGNGLKEIVHPSPFSQNCTECHYHGAGYSNTIDGLF